MIKKVFNGVDEHLYYEKLDNGLEIYLYPTKKSKNFYATISVKYGSRVEEYEKAGVRYEIIPGTAHFLEHKVLAITEKEGMSDRINNLGSFANAWTDTTGTNYNILGSKDILENIRILFDNFYHFELTNESVEKEKGIIGEEIDLNEDKINYKLHRKLLYNLFNNSYVKNTTVGTRKDINKLTKEDLLRVYNDFYIPNNTFIVVIGDFDKNEVLSFIKSYLSKLNLHAGEIPKRIIKNEENKVFKEYEVIKKDISDDKVRIGFKMPKSIFGDYDENELLYYLTIIFDCNFCASSSYYEKYKNNELIIDFGYSVYTIDDYIVVECKTSSRKSNEFIDALLNDINSLSLDKETFERMKKRFLKYYILNFDDIEEIEYNISDSIMELDHIDYNEFNLIKNLDYDEAKRIMQKINTDNKSIVKAEMK